MSWRTVLTILLCGVIFFACGPKKKATMEPPPPAEIETVPGEPFPAPSSPPPKSLEAPSLKPRAPSRGDSAALKIVESGVKQLNAGNQDEAEQLFEQALRVSPTNGRPYYYLGVIAAQKKDYDRSLAFFTQAEVYLHEDGFWMSQVLTREGVILKALNQKAAARQKLQEALRRNPANKWAEAELQALQN